MHLECFSGGEGKEVGENLYWTLELPCFLCEPPPGAEEKRRSQEDTERWAYLVVCEPGALVLFWTHPFSASKPSSEVGLCLLFSLLLSHLGFMAPCLSRAHHLRSLKATVYGM